MPSVYSYSQKELYCRFDTELNKAQEEVRTEKALKEKLQRERDTLAAEQYSLEKEVQVGHSIPFVIFILNKLRCNQHSLYSGRIKLFSIYC